MFDPLCPVRVFQRVNDLPPSGELDEATLAVMRQPRCGMEDPFNKKLHKFRIMGKKLLPVCQPGKYERKRMGYSFTK